MGISLFVTTSFEVFDTERRNYIFDVVVLKPSKSDKSDTPLTIHFWSGTLTAKFDEISPNVRPWGDGTSTVPNMRSHPGPVTKLINELRQLGQITTIDNDPVT